MSIKEFNDTVNKIKLEDPVLAKCVLFMSCVGWPGWSTILAGYFAKGEFAAPAYVIGLIQVLTSPILIGWIWAIMNAWQIYKNSTK